MHVPGEHQFVKSAVGPFQVGHELRNHPDHAPAGTQGSVREVAHRPLGAAPENQGNARLGDYPAELLGRPVVGGIAAAARCAIDTDAFYLHDRDRSEGRARLGTLPQFLPASVFQVGIKRLEGILSPFTLRAVSIPATGSPARSSFPIWASTLAWSQ